jgi:hypothetical protein
MNYVNELKKHMLTSDNFKRYISDIIKQDISYQKLDQSPEYYVVKEEDSLFWSFFIVTFGMEKYIMNKGKNYDVQQKIKISAIESMKDNKSILKQYKLSKTEIEQNLLYDTQISYASFMYLSLLHKQNIVIIDGRVYYECIGNPDDSSLTMFKKNNHHYVIYSIVEKDYALQYYKITNMSKRILSISSYKLVDLQNMCKKLKLEVDGKKMDLYERIVKCIN